MRGMRRGEGRKARKHPSIDHAVVLTSSSVADVLPLALATSCGPLLASASLMFPRGPR